MAEPKEPEALNHSNDDQPARKVTAWQSGALTESYFRKRDYEPRGVIPSREDGEESPADTR